MNPDIDIKIYYTNRKLEKIKGKIRLMFKLRYKIPLKKLIQKNIIEEIGRGVLNNSMYLVKQYQPFTKPISESNGENDNIGNNYEIDTKLLLIEKVCEDISCGKNVFSDNEYEHDFFVNIYIAYQRYCNNEKPEGILEKNQQTIIKKMIQSLEKYKHKNLIYIYPFPQFDYITNVNRNVCEVYPKICYKGFLTSYIATMCEMMRELKIKYHCDHDLFFAYPLHDNRYNLIKIDNDKIICESFIEVPAQNKYIEICEWGITELSTNKFFPILILTDVASPVMYKLTY